MVRIWRPLELLEPVRSRSLTPRRPRHHRVREGCDVTGGAAGAYHSWRSRWTGDSNRIGRVARRRMADVAKNGSLGPGTPDIEPLCGTLGRDQKGNKS